MTTEIISALNQSLSISLSEKISMEELKLALADHINGLIQKDFTQLITILYRVDVSEPKLKRLLQEQPAEDAGQLIAALIIERQIQKIETRRAFRKSNNADTGEEPW